MVKFNYNNFLPSIHKDISNKFEKDGYVIFDIKKKESLKKIKKKLFQFSKKNLKKNIFENEFFNNAHKFIDLSDINDFRLKIINEMNKDKELRFLYYDICSEFLDILVGNELAMQQRINLSIQMPKDSTSLLPLHSDVWSGDSPYEVVVWLPLVNCYRSKSMYILPPSKLKKVDTLVGKKKINSSHVLFKKLKKNLKWINIKFGQVLIFNQCLPHGNIVNNENETRWSFNCRFKGIFTPYKDKKLGEFFEPITLKKISQLGMKYKFPKTK